MKTENKEVVKTIWDYLGFKSVIRAIIRKMIMAEVKKALKERKR